jgi:hypothetical protein
MVSALAAPAAAEPREVIGYLGVLGEWELIATVAEIATGRPQEFAGPATMTHVGLCTQDGPERKAGEIKVQLSASRLKATLSFEGVECTYHATLSDAYKGQMACPDRPAVPLTLWLR